MPRYFIESMGDGTIEASSLEHAEAKLRSMFAAALANHCGSIGLPKVDIYQGWVTFFRSDFGKLLRIGFRMKEANGT